MKQFSLRMVKELYKALQEESARLGLSMNALIVTILFDYIEGN